MDHAFAEYRTTQQRGAYRGRIRNRSGWRAALAFCLIAAAPAHADADRTAAVLATENARVAAMTQADLPALERVLAADLSYGHSNGRIDDRASLLDALRARKLVYRSMRVSELTVRFAGDSALVRGRADVSVGPDGREESFALRYLAVYAWRERRWQLTAYQSVKLP